MAKQHALKLVPEEDDPGEVVPGGYRITDDQLKRLGNGDVKRGRRWLRLLMSDVAEPRKIVGPTPRPTEVRLGKPTDDLALFDMLIASYRENASNLYPIAPDRVVEDVQRATHNREGGIAGIIDDPTGKPIAMILLGAQRWPCSNAWYLQASHNYVLPEHRKSRHAENLIKFARWCADEWSRGFGYAVYLGLSCTAQTNVEAKVRFFKRHAAQVGAMFMYPDPHAR